jgi:hypothetical protein
MRGATRHSRWAMIAITTLLAADGLAAQANPNAPPPVIQIQIESVRQGRGGPHQALEQQWSQTFRQSGAPVYWLGATTETGPSEAWYFTPMGGFGDIEKMEKAVESSPGLGAASDVLAQADGENVSEMRTVLARYRADLSMPGDMSVANGRYFNVITFRVRPGHEGDLAKAVALYKTVMTEAKSDANFVMYQVASGMPGPTFIGFGLMKSLSEMDPGADSTAINKAMTADRMKSFDQLSASGIISTTNIILRFQPRMSTMPKEFTDQDPSFWNVRR